MSFRPYKRSHRNTCSNKRTPNNPVSLSLYFRGTATLSCAALTAIGNPDYIRLFFSKETGQIMIKPSRKHDHALRLSVAGVFSFRGFANQFNIVHPVLDATCWDDNLRAEIPLMVGGGNHTALICSFGTFASGDDA